MNTKDRIEKIQGEILAKDFIIVDFRYVQQQRIQRMKKVTFQSSTGRDIYIVQFTIYSFTRFNHLLYIAIYYI